MATNCKRSCNCARPWRAGIADATETVDSKLSHSENSAILRERRHHGRGGIQTPIELRGRCTEAVHATMVLRPTNGTSSLCARLVRALTSDRRGQPTRDTRSWHRNVPQGRKQRAPAYLHRQVSAARMARASSEPVAMMMASGVSVPRCRRALNISDLPGTASDGETGAKINVVGPSTRPTDDFGNGTFHRIGRTPSLEVGSVVGRYTCSTGW